MNLAHSAISLAEMPVKHAFFGKTNIGRHVKIVFHCRPILDGVKKRVFCDFY